MTRYLEWYAPFPWRDKAKRLLATKAQATFAQGTHTFSLTEDVLTKIRSNIMRAMFSVDFFSMRYFYRRNWIPTSATYTKVWGHLHDAYTMNKLELKFKDDVTLRSADPLKGHVVNFDILSRVFSGKKFSS